MGLNLGDIVPDFKAESTMGTIKFHEYIDGSWAILLSHPSDFTPVCTSELGSLASRIHEFDRRGVKVIALSCNDVNSHREWLGDIESYCPETKVKYPIVADPSRDLAVRFGMLDPVEKDAAGMPLTCRACFVIGPDKRVRLSILYPASTGRNFSELVRVIDSLQLTDKFSVATPANWENGRKCMILPTISDEKAKEMFPKGFDTVKVPSGKAYIRLVEQPTL
ncbi:hypothetical protein SELMODRAFT_181036 [Selaginella moellendorffii]|uniref:Peroxiredoxin n=1 Tax=Selaginella moellendorffii TaxID=88036 RepID=D8SMC0_SELML|nr:hypothetical protein SELMODRAFT_181036 [Selaginella moellendorffii]